MGKHGKTTVKSEKQTESPKVVAKTESKSEQKGPQKSSHSFAKDYLEAQIDAEFLEDFDFEVRTNLLKDKYLELVQSEDDDDGVLVALITAVSIKGTIGKQELLTYDESDYTGDDIKALIKSSNLFTSTRANASLNWYISKLDQTVFRRFLSTKEGEALLRAKMKTKNKLLATLISQKVAGVENSVEKHWWIFKIYDHLSVDQTKKEFSDLDKVLSDYQSHDPIPGYNRYLVSTLSLIARILVTKQKLAKQTMELVMPSVSGSEVSLMYISNIAKYVCAEKLGLTSQNATKIGDLFLATTPGKNCKALIDKAVTEKLSQDSINAIEFV
jgi:hypothetical protein